MDHKDPKAKGWVGWFCIRKRSRLNAEGEEGADVVETKLGRSHVPLRDIRTR